MKIKNDEPQDIFIYTKPFSINEDYYVVTSDYLANGGDNCSFFGNPILYETTGVKLRDAIINYCEDLTKNNRHIYPHRINGIRISKTV